MIPSHWLSRRDLRTLLGGLAVILVIFGFGRGLPALGSARERALAAAVLARQQSVRTRDLGRSRGLVASTANASRTRLMTLERGTFPGGTPAEAAASLVLLVEEYATRSMVKVVSTSAKSDTLFATSYPRISVRVHGTADSRGLLELLALFDASDRTLAIRELTVTQPEPAAEDRAPENLRVEFVVEALARAGTALARPTS